VAGLGNPGPRYAASRHNVGFMVVDALAGRWSADVSRHEARFQGLLGRTERGGETVLLLKPMTFMNLSGQSVAAAARYYKVALADVLVVHDDLDLPLGQLRIRSSGSAGGHKGLADVIRHMRTSDVARLRVGIGKVHRSATVDHVLGRFDTDERPVMEEAVTRAADAVACWLSRGVAVTMNEFNRRRDGGASSGPPAGAEPVEGE
jgi:PTH1 family peptidyl-tRNA hydrolase